jgi:hypothetical protein
MEIVIDNLPLFLAKEGENMSDFFTIEMTYSEYHLLFPRITISLLIIIGALLLITNLIKKVKAGDGRFRFFSKNYDKRKLYGTVILLVLYGVTLDILGFILSTVIFVILSTLLYIGNLQKKSLIISITSSIATTFVFWYVFGQLFDITLP